VIGWPVVARNGGFALLALAVAAGMTLDVTPIVVPPIVVALASLAVGFGLAFVLMVYAYRQRLVAAGRTPVRLVAGIAVNPVWSPDGTLIVYNGASVSVDAPLLAVRPDGTPVELPAIRVRVEGERHRFLPNGKGLVYMLGSSISQDFWLLDLTTKTSRQLTRLNNSDAMRTFDITPDGKQIVFDRLRENSDIVLIDLPK
jgi:hypothetical protein